MSSSDLAHGLPAVRRVHLVAAPVAVLRGRVRRRRGTGRRTRTRTWRVGQDRRRLEPVGVEGRPDRADAAVHHVGRARRCRLRPARARRRCRASSSRLRRLPPRRPASMPQCPWDVYSQRQTSVTTTRSGTCARRRPDAHLHDALVVEGLARSLVLARREAEEDHRGNAGGVRGGRPLDERVDGEVVLAAASTGSPPHPCRAAQTGAGSGQPAKPGSHGRGLAPRPCGAGGADG